MAMMHGPINISGKLLKKRENVNALVCGN